MKKIKIIQLIQFFIWILAGITDGILGIVLHFDVRFYYTMVFTLIGSGLLNLMFIVIKELSVLSYDSQRFIPILYALHIIFGVLAYYLVKYINRYDSYAWLYWLGLGFGFVLPIGIVIILSRKKGKPQGNGPKVIVNKK